LHVSVLNIGGVCRCTYAVYRDALAVQSDSDLGALALLYAGDAAHTGSMRAAVGGADGLRQRRQCEGRADGLVERHGVGQTSSGRSMRSAWVVAGNARKVRGVGCVGKKFGGLAENGCARAVGGAMAGVLAWVLARANWQARLVASSAFTDVALK
jgi:hypothetical protein